jgi:hypothetical protein
VLFNDICSCYKSMYLQARQHTDKLGVEWAGLVSGIVPHRKKLMKGECTRCLSMPWSRPQLLSLPLAQVHIATSAGEVPTINVDFLEVLD